MKIYYLSKTYKDKLSAGNKAKTDIEAILANHGAINAGLSQKISKNSISGFFYTLASVLRTLFCLKKGSILVLQYPFKKYYKFCCQLAHFRGSKVVTLIHDLGSFRRRKLTPEKEIRRLNHSDYIIAHNENMKQWLLDNKIKAEVGCLEIFDYLTSEKANNTKKQNQPYKVVYAGSLNIRKNEFLYKLGEYVETYTLSLYGGGFDTSIAKNPDKFDSKGFVQPDELIVNADGHFGLVWDGDSVSECGGLWGTYLKYNNPHKTSLYIRCLLPIIIWEQAALAPFIEKHNIGICIDSLENLDTVLAGIDREQYAKMIDNISLISDRLSKGYYTIQAVEAAKNYFESIS